MAQMTDRQRIPSSSKSVVSELTMSVAPEPPAINKPPINKETRRRKTPKATTALRNKCDGTVVSELTMTGAASVTSSLAPVVAPIAVVKEKRKREKPKSQMDDLQRALNVLNMASGSSTSSKSTKISSIKSPNHNNDDNKTTTDELQDLTELQDLKLKLQESDSSLLSLTLAMQEQTQTLKELRAELIQNKTTDTSRQERRPEKGERINKSIIQEDGRETDSHNKIRSEVDSFMPDEMRLNFPSGTRKAPESDKKTDVAKTGNTKGRKNNRSSAEEEMRLRFPNRTKTSNNCDETVLTDVAIFEPPTTRQTKTNNKPSRGHTRKQTVNEAVVRKDAQASQHSRSSRTRASNEKHRGRRASTSPPPRMHNRRRSLTPEQQERIPSNDKHSRSRRRASSTSPPPHSHMRNNRERSVSPECRGSHHGRPLPDKHNRLIARSSRSNYIDNRRRESSSPPPHTRMPRRQSMPHRHNHHRATSPVSRDRYSSTHSRSEPHYTDYDRQDLDYGRGIHDSDRRNSRDRYVSHSSRSKPHYTTDSGQQDFDNKGSRKPPPRRTIRRRSMDHNYRGQDQFDEHHGRTVQRRYS